MKTQKISRFLVWMALILTINSSFAQTSRNMGLSGGPDGDYPGYPFSGTFNLLFNNVAGTGPLGQLPLAPGSLQIVAVVPPGIEMADSYTAPTGWLYTKTGPQTATLLQVGPVSSSPPASFVSFAIPLSIKAAVDEGVWSAQLQRILPTYIDPDPTNNSPNGVVTVADVPLPVTLSSFEVAKEGTTADLKWSTVEEVNSDYFIMQHSVDGKKWTEIGRIESHKDSKQLNNYSYTHTLPSPGENYYRLKMVDRDFTFAYSSIRSVSFEGRSIRVYPNPAADVLYISQQVSAKLEKVVIYNSSGTSVYNSDARIADKINVRNFPAGMYLIHMVYTTGTVDVQKILVSR